MDLVQVTYTNYRGITAVRRIRPIRIHFASTAWHPDPQWLLECFCLDKQATRDFALSGLGGDWRALPCPVKEG
jgi:hypothetical protein